MGNEVELKLELTEPIYRALLARVKDDITDFKEQENYFFDSAGEDLNKKKWALRIRLEKQKNRGVITAKGPRLIQDDAHIRPEFEETIPLKEAMNLLGGFSIENYPYLPFKKLVEYFGPLRMKEFVQFTNHRTVAPWEGMTLEIDKTIIKDRIFYELEIESSMEETKAVQTRIRSFFISNQWPFVLSKLNKLVKALRIYGK